MIAAKMAPPGWSAPSQPATSAGKISGAIAVPGCRCPVESWKKPGKNTIIFAGFLKWGIPHQ